MCMCGSSLQTNPLAYDTKDFKAYPRFLAQRLCQLQGNPDSNTAGWGGGGGEQNLNNLNKPSICFGLMQITIFHTRLAYC